MNHGEAKRHTMTSSDKQSANLQSPITFYRRLKPAINSKSDRVGNWPKLHNHFQVL